MSSSTTSTYAGGDWFPACRTASSAASDAVIPKMMDADLWAGEVVWCRPSADTEEMYGESAEKLEECV